MSKIGERTRGLVVTACLITSNHFDEIYAKFLGGAMATFDKIADWSVEFDQEHSDYDWEESELDFEEKISEWVTQKLSESPRRR